MNRKTDHSREEKQQSSKTRLLLFHSSNQRQRMTPFSIRLLSGYTFQLKLRRFRTKPANRSKKLKQLVIGCSIFEIKEVAISIVRIKPRSKQATLPIKALRQISNVFVLTGTIGLLYFGLPIIGIGRQEPPQVRAEESEQVQAIAETISPEPVISLSRSIPSTIFIDRINLEASIVQVGLLADGSIETPDLFSGTVGWYNNGPTPGEIGPAVLIGHVDTYKGPSVFWNLSKLAAGDIVRITRDDGQTVMFRVSSIVSYSQDEFNTDAVYGNTNYAGLRIITCGGRFNYITGRYSHNTVVFAEMLNE
jgi:hypothetical protein